jgi:hypothetical protein
MMPHRVEWIFFIFRMAFSNHLAKENYCDAVPYRRAIKKGLASPFLIATVLM